MNGADWWRQVVKRTAEQTADPLVREWLGDIAAEGEFVSVGCRGSVQPRRLLTVAGPDLLAAMAWWDAAGRKERAAAERWWLSLDRT